MNKYFIFLILGVPYRRGYLLYGPPGTGKTSFSQAIAGHVGMKLYILNLSADNMNDDSLSQRMGEVSADSIILVEDIDAIFIDRTAV